jgi:ELWxxDGT repeat protein
VDIDALLSWNSVLLPFNHSFNSYEYYIGTGSSFTNVCSSTYDGVNYGNGSNWNGINSNYINNYSNCNGGSVYLTPGTTYNWKVRVSYTNPSGGIAYGPYSATGTFTTQNFSGGSLIRDIYAGTTASSPNQLVASGSTAYFFALSASGTNNNGELWRTDGSSGGTTIVRDIFPGTTGSSGTGLILSNGRLFFSARSSTAIGQELWTSDGTNAGTLMVKDINSVANVSGLATQPWITDVNGTVFFAASNGTTGT